METVLALMITAGAIVGFVRYSAERRLAAERGRVQGQLQHRRSGDYTSSCSWCKNTALARKLFVFERTHGTWEVRDVIGQLQVCSDGEVSALANVLVADHPQWRRFCTERCAGEFFRTEHVRVTDTFVGCAYCSVRFPLALVRCPNCGAASSTS